MRICKHLKARFARIFLGLLLVLGFQGHLWGGSLRKVWELNLGEAIKNSGWHDIGRPGILALRFSADGRTIALATSPYRAGGVVLSHLILVHVLQPQKDIREFQIENIASDSGTLGIKPPAVAWSPEGTIIIAGNNLVHVVDGGICELPTGFGGGFITPDQIVALPIRKDGSSQFKVYNSDCQLTHTWEVKGQWTFSDVSVERGLISALRKTSREVAQPAEELLVVDPIAEKIVQSWATSATGYSSRFADHGKVLCVGDNGGDFADPREVPPRCMDIDGGNRIAEITNINGGSPFAISENTSRVVTSDYRNVWNFIYREYDTELKRRVVWDFRKNVEIVSWSPSIQTYSLLVPRPARDPFTFAISPDGQYIAEGGNGVLRLYKIEP
jgi:hypothetical protein